MIQTPKPGIEVVSPDRTPTREWTRWLREQLIGRIVERSVPTAIQTSDYTAEPWDRVLANPSGGAFTVTFPSRAKTGDVVSYKNVTTSTNVVTFAPATGHTVDGGASVTNSTALGAERFEFDADPDRLDWSRM